jgi:hypothetical protein
MCGWSSCHQTDDAVTFDVAAPTPTATPTRTPTPVPLGAIINQENSNTFNAVWNDNRGSKYIALTKCTGTTCNNHNSFARLANCPSPVQIGLSTSDSEVSDPTNKWCKYRITSDVVFSGTTRIKSFTFNRSSILGPGKFIFALTQEVEDSLKCSGNPACQENQGTSGMCGWSSCHQTDDAVTFDVAAPTATATPTRTPTPIPPTATRTPTPTAIPPTPTATPTNTPTATPTRTPTPIPPTPTRTPTPLPTYSITYNGNGNTSGVAPKNQTKIFNQSITVSQPGTLQKTGSNFLEWRTAPRGRYSTFKPGDSYTANSDVTLYAHWSQHTPTPTATATIAPITPTATAVPPTATAVPPTATAVPPTATLTPDTCPNFAIGNATCDLGGIIDNNDYNCWRANFLTARSGATPTPAIGCTLADFDKNNTVNLLDFAIWRIGYKSSISPTATTNL